MLETSIFVIIGESWTKQRIYKPKDHEYLSVIDQNDALDQDYIDDHARFRIVIIVIYHMCVKRLRCKHKVKSDGRRHYILKKQELL